MSLWQRKRFWTDVTVERLADGHTVLLDGRPLRTPAKAQLVVPTRALATYLATEWAAVDERVVPERMPATRAANAAIDKVRGQKAEVAHLVADYGDSDLICYRAEAPAALAVREAVAWDPLIDWAAQRYGARLEVRHGVMHTPQPAQALAALRGPVDAMSSFELTAFHDLVALSGSLVIGLAVIERYARDDDLWARSRIDEDWQAEQWGSDAEAQALADQRYRSFVDAVRFLRCLQQAD